MMESFIASLTNWKTTIVGLLSAIVIYEAGVGNKIPENKQEWGAFTLGVLALMLGVASKDATTGSRPKAILLPFILVAALTLTGCVGHLHELSKDGASVCARVKAVLYGEAAICRTNTPGEAALGVSKDGEVMIRHRGSAQP